MEELILIKPDIHFAEQISLYRQEFIDAGDSMDGCGGLREREDPVEWIQLTSLMEIKENVPPHLVPATQFIYVRKSDNVIVGMIQIRHSFNEYLEKFGGHIGYSVRPSERRKGYATKMLCECLPCCKDIGLKKVLITCTTDNEGSRKTILANGGFYESTVFEPVEKVHLERYWITLPLQDWNPAR